MPGVGQARLTSGDAARGRSMPGLLDRAVEGVRASSGKGKTNPWAVATAALQKSGALKKGSQELTAKGRARSKMTPAQRAKTR